MKREFKNIRDQLMSRIDTTDLVEVNKVNRYIKLLEIDELCSKAILKDGPTITIKNGPQEFTKSHPAFLEKEKIAKQLIELEASIKFVRSKKYSKSDLV